MSEQVLPGAVQIDGQKFDYVEAGQGESVIFLHGALGDVRTFSPHCDRISFAPC